MNLLKESCEVKGCKDRALGVFQFDSTHPWYKKSGKKLQYLCKKHAADANKIEHIISYVKADVFQRSYIFGLSLESAPFFIDSADPEQADILDKEFLDDSSLSIDTKDYNAKNDLESMSSEEIEFIDVYDKLFADIRLHDESILEIIYIRFISWWNKKKYLEVIKTAKYIGIQIPDLPLYMQVQYLKALQKTTYVQLPTKYSKSMENEIEQDLAAFSV